MVFSHTIVRSTSQYLWLMGVVCLLLSGGVLAVGGEPAYVGTHNSIRSALSGGMTVDDLSANQDQDYDFALQSKPNTALTPLRYDSSLELSAWYQARTCQLTHSNTSNGENVFAARGFDWSIQSAVQSWAWEVRHVDSKQACSSGQDCGNYTQVVWAKSAKVGCAISQCSTVRDQNGQSLWGGDSGVVAVCQYAERGNISGQKPYVARQVVNPAPEIEPPVKANTQVMTVIVSLLLD